MKEAQAWFYLPGVTVCKTSIFLNRKGGFFTNLLDYRNPNLARIRFDGSKVRDGSVHFHTKDEGYRDTFVIAPHWRGGIYKAPDLEAPFSLSVREFRPAVPRNKEYFRVFTKEGMLIVTALKKDRVATWAEQRGHGKPLIEPATQLDVETLRFCGGEPIDTSI